MAKRKSRNNAPKSKATKAGPKGSRIRRAWNQTVSSSPGLAAYSGATVRPWEANNQVGRWRKTQVLDLVNRFTKYVAVAQGRNAQAVASCPLRVMRRVKGGRKSAWDARPVARKELLRQRSRAGAWTRKAAELSEEVEEITDPLHPLVAMLNRPNPFLTGFGSLEQTQLSMGLAGDAYWYIVSGSDGMPIEAWPLPPQFVQAIPNVDTIIGGYIYGRGTEIEKTFPAEQIVRFTLPNPKGDPYRGFSDLEKCIMDADLSVAFSEIRLAMIDNGAQPGLVVVAKGASPDQRDKLEEIVNQKFAGVQKAGRSMVLNGDITVTPWSMTEKEVKYLDSDSAVRETIANCHDMSSALMTLDSAALATAEAAIPQWQEQAIKPRCNRIADTINLRLVPMFYGLQGGDQLYVVFDEAVEKDSAADAAVAVSMYAGDIITKNEARALTDYDAVPDGDKFASEYVQANALETLAATPTPTIAGGENPGDKPASDSDSTANEDKPAAKELAHKASCCCGTHEKALDPLTPDEAALMTALTAWFNGLSPLYIAQLTAAGVTKSLISTMSRTLGQAIDMPIARTFLTGWNEGVRELGSNAGTAQTQFVVTTPNRATVSIIQPAEPPAPVGVAVELTPTPSLVAPTPPTLTQTPQGTLTTPVEKYLREYRGKTIRSVTTTADARIRQEIADGIAKGETVPELTTRVQSVVGDMSRYSAERIARTESSRAFNAAREKSWMESGNVWGKRLILSPDACSFCKTLAKQYGVGALGTAFVNKGDTVTLDDGAEVEIDYSDIEEPPLHPNCVLGDTEVLPGSIVAVTRALYRGNVITVRTRNGRVLSCTENHNVLTQRGFVPASSLDEGDNLVCGVDSGWSFVAPHGDDRPTTIEKVFESLSSSSSVPTYSVPPSPIQFHGDGRSFVSKIDVVAPNGLLWDGIDTRFLKKVCERSLGRTVSDDEPLSGRRNLDAMLLSLRFAAYGRVAEGSHAASLLGAGVGHPEIHRLAAVSLSDPVLAEPSYDSRAGNSENIGECLDALSGVVEADEVVSIEINAFHGFVYDLSTVSGAYLSNGIISHNCRCSIVMVMEEPK